MAHGVGRRAPYAVVILLHGMTTDPISGPYFRGRLALAGIGLHTPLRDWLDAVYAIWLDAPSEKFEKASRTMVISSAKLRPNRETWGITPEQQALGGKLQAGPGLEAAGHGAPGSPLPPAIQRTVRQHR